MPRFERLLVKERELGDAITIQDILPEVAGVYPKIMTEGAMDEGAWSCGMVAGLIHDIPTCQELIDRIMLQAEEIIARMQAMARALTAVPHSQPPQRPQSPPR